MQAGKLRHRIDIQEDRGTTDLDGKITPRWVTIATVYSQIAPVAGTVTQQDGKQQAEITHEISLRYLTGVSSEMRIVHGQRTFGVVSVLVDERNRELKLFCAERKRIVFTSTVTIQKATFAKGASGAEESTWTDLFTGIVANIAEQSRDRADDNGQLYTEQVFAIHLESNYDLDRTHRLIDEDGTIYSFEEYQRESFEELSKFTAVVNPLPK